MKVKPIFILLIVATGFLLFVNGFLVIQNNSYKMENRQLLLQNDSILSENIVLKDTLRKINETASHLQLSSANK